MKAPRHVRAHGRARSGDRAARQASRARRCHAGIPVTAGGCRRGPRPRRCRRTGLTA